MGKAMESSEVVESVVKTVSVPQGLSEPEQKVISDYLLRLKDGN